LAAITLSSGQRKEDEVLSIPDQENIKNLSSKWHSGYFNVTRYKKLHYIFIDSLNKPETDPIIIIFNGGPGGASTFLAFYLIGPYTISSTSKNLTDFPVTWARNASLLFIDNPAGVGFSYAQREVDWISNDVSNNKDLLNFLFQFYSFWP
jgi:carboxypeptidase C (cathepsin A)